jgi:hypothetical protein
MIRRGALLLPLTGLTLLVIAYIALYNPFNFEVVQALADLVKDIVAVALLVTLGGALGAALLGEVAVLADFTPRLPRRWPKRGGERNTSLPQRNREKVRQETFMTLDLLLPGLNPLSDLERAALLALLGLGLIGLAVLTAGVLGFLPPAWLGWLIMAVLLAIFFRPARAWLYTARDGLRAAFAPEQNVFTRWVRRGVGLLVLLAILQALAPPSAWEALSYHLAVPQFYLEAGRITTLPPGTLAPLPQLVEMLYLWLLILARPSAAALLHGCFGMFLFSILIGVGRRIGRPGAGWVAAAALLTSRTLWQALYCPLHNLAVMAYSLAALVALFTWRSSGDEPRPRFLVLTGLLAGLAVGVEYMAVGAVVGIAGLTLWLARRDGRGKPWLSVGMVSVFGLLVLAPWLIRNVLIEGNLLPLSGWSTPLAAYASLLNPDPRVAPLVGVAPLEGRVLYRLFSGLLVIGLLLLIPIGWRERGDTERSLISHLLIFSLPPSVLGLAELVIGWPLIQSRLLSPALPALALAGALGLEGLQTLKLPPRVGGLVRLPVLVAFLLAVTGSTLEAIRSAPLQVVTGIQPSADYLSQKLGAYEEAVQQINTLSEDARVLALWEPRFFYCLPRCIPDSGFDRWLRDRQQTSDPLDVAARWREQGITHVLIHEAGLDWAVSGEAPAGLGADDRAALDVLREQALALIWEWPGQYRLYALQEAVP